jgi:hypothetical protein
LDLVTMPVVLPKSKWTPRAQPRNESPSAAVGPAVAAEMQKK